MEKHLRIRNNEWVVFIGQDMAVTGTNDAYVCLHPFSSISIENAQLADAIKDQYSLIDGQYKLTNYIKPKKIPVTIPV